MKTGKPLNKYHLTRYSRHLSLPEIGKEGQQRLLDAAILVVGAGGLGSPVLQYLSAAGVGTIRIADFDNVELSNLQRQVLFREEDTGKPKAEIAARFAKNLNSDIEVEVISRRVNSGNARELVKRSDIVVDCTDNFETRYALNDACVLEDKPLVYGSVFRFEGQVAVFNALLDNGKRSSCYRDLFPEPPPPGLAPDCAEAGVSGALTGIIGSIQAMEVIKLITGAGEPLAGKLLVFDSLSMKSDLITIPDRGARKNIKTVQPVQQTCTRQDEIPQITPAELKKWNDENRNFELIDVREPYEREIASIGGRLIPKNEIADQVESFDNDKPIVLYCRSGKRSLDAAHTLHNLGVKNLYNLEGGILRWIDEVDPELNKY